MSISKKPSNSTALQSPLLYAVGLRWLLRVVLTVMVLPSVFLVNGQVATETLQHRKHLESLSDSTSTGQGLRKEVSSSKYFNTPDSSNLDSSLQLKDRASDLLNNKATKSGGMEFPISIDSTAVDDSVKEKVTNSLHTPQCLDSVVIADFADQQKDQAKRELEKQLGVQLPGSAMVDSLTLDNVAEKSENILKSHIGQKGELSKLTGSDPMAKSMEVPDNIKAKTEELKLEQMKQLAREKMVSSARAYVEKHASEIEIAQSQMAMLKQKYSSVPNSNDLSTAVKRFSLKGDSLKFRFVPGLNCSIVNTHPVDIDFSPALSFRINKLFTAGALINLGVCGTFVNKSFEISTDRMGYGVYVSHLFLRGFLVYAEINSIRTQHRVDDKITHRWVQPVLVGGGKGFSLSPCIAVQTLVVYNLLHNRQRELYESPVVLKTALRFGQRD